MESEAPLQTIFNADQVGNFVAYAETLRKIHARLLAEGYQITGNTITNPADQTHTKSS